MKSLWIVLHRMNNAKACMGMSEAAVSIRIEHL